MKAIRKVGGWLADYPLLVSGLIVVLVIAHFFVAQRYPILNVAADLAASDPKDPRGTLSELSLGVAAVSALVGGFAGVVVVFGLGTENDRFRLLRQEGTHRLRANWISVVLSSFAGAFGSVVSAVIVLAFGGEPGMWVLEVCLLVAAHGAIRLTALLAGLAGIVDKSDQDRITQENTVSSEGLIPEKGRVPDE